MPKSLLACTPLALAAWTVLCTGAAAAQQSANSAYMVEIIVFRASAPGPAEDWTEPAPRGFGNDSGKAGAAPELTKTLTPADYRLGGIETTLRGSGAWKPLAHAAWVQTAALWGSAHIGISLADVGINVPGVAGTVYLERGQYLHLGFNVSYNNGPTYTINEMRSIKLGDKQYFDHPAFGIIATVTAVKN